MLRITCGEVAMDRPDKRQLWRDEFSVYAAEDRYVLRRQFTKFLVLTSFGMFAGNVWIWVRWLLARSPNAFPEVQVASASEIPVGGVRLFTYPTPKDTAIMVRKVDGSLVAY